MNIWIILNMIMEIQEQIKDLPTTISNSLMGNQDVSVI